MQPQFGDKVRIRFILFLPSDSDPNKISILNMEIGRHFRTSSLFRDAIVRYDDVNVSVSTKCHNTYTGGHWVAWKVIL